ncbi:hypothetical protein GIB67_025381 [Kingdonia uniflora]|uniref:Uncharacterized protein n=1 Tax=Kingdonia uniflora TaxID=39325 RepID=A0A7J7NBM2_9MAGN|nr:hypothetical protein GIB67_025381 [Kingdonia uniflora]
MSLKPNKVAPVRQQLSSVHPELLLFLSKIKQLNVWEKNIDPKLNSVSAISISSETEFMTRKNMDVVSYTLYLSVEENEKELEKECSYYMWKQKFPVKVDNQVKSRDDIDEWAITLAFPNGQRLNRGMSSPGVYAYLPTNMVTNADFILSSSRETILLDNKWNEGILNCVSSTFFNALNSLVKTTEAAPVSSLPRMLEFLPVKTSSYPQLNVVRESIQKKVKADNIISCESSKKQKIFSKPDGVGRVSPAFWNILIDAKKQGVSFETFLSHGRYILSSAFDNEAYNEVLNFLGVSPMDNKWYVKCIQSSNLIFGVSDDVYMDLLMFLASNWTGRFNNTNIRNIPLLKYVGEGGNVTLWSIACATQLGKRLHLSGHHKYIAWPIDCNKELGYAASHFFMSKSTQDALAIQPKRGTLQEWLRQNACVKPVPSESFLSSSEWGSLFQRGCVLVDIPLIDQAFYDNKVNNYMEELRTLGVLSEFGEACRFIGEHLMTLSTSSNLTKANVLSILKFIRLLREMYMPPEDFITMVKEGKWLKTSHGFMSPLGSILHGSEWAAASTISNLPFIDQQYYGEEILSFREELQLLGVITGFNKNYQLVSKNFCLPGNLAAITAESVLLILQCIKHSILSDAVLSDLKSRNWLVTSLGCKSPTETFLFHSEWGSLLNVFNNYFPKLNESFYGSKILLHKEELQKVGVIVTYQEAAVAFAIGFKELKSSASLSKESVFSLMDCYRSLKESAYRFPMELLQCIMEEKWVKTRLGYRSPKESILLCDTWEPLIPITKLPFIDSYYGPEVRNTKAS